VATPRQSGRLPVPTSAARRPPGPSTRVMDRFPGPFSRLWSCLQMVPVSDGESISTPLAGIAQESVAIHFKFVRYPRVTHRTNRLIRT
jgi:hypothetical protein